MDEMIYFRVEDHLVRAQSTGIKEVVRLRELTPALCALKSYVGTFLSLILGAPSVLALE